MSNLEKLLDSLKAEIKPENAKLADLGFDFVKGIFKQSFPIEDIFGYLTKINSKYKAFKYTNSEGKEIELYDLDTMLVFSTVLISIIDASKQDNQ